MESNTKYKLEPDEEKFLDEVSAVFEPVREKYLIREAVQKKVAGSNFRLLDFTKPGGLLAWKYPLIISAIIGLSVGSWFAFGPAAKDGGNTSAKTENPVKIESVAPPVKIQIPEYSESARANTRQDTKASDATKIQPEIAINQKNARTLQTLTTKQQLSRIEKTERMEHKTALNLPAGYNPMELKQNLSGIIDRLGLKAIDSNESGSLFLLQTVPVNGFYSKIDSKPVDFYLEFRILSENPTKLLIKLIYNENNSSDSKSRDFDMENIFYEKLRNELLKLFK